LRDLPAKNYEEEDSRDSFVSPPTSKKRKRGEPKPVQHSTPLEKPKKTYVEIVATALLAAPDHRLVISDIYASLEVTYEYFRETTSWKSTVRHCLSASECFIRLEERVENACYWTIHPQCLQVFQQGKFSKRCYQAAIHGKAIPTRPKRTSPARKKARTTDFQSMASSRPLPPHDTPRRDGMHRHCARILGYASTSPEVRPAT
jgi:hypothetical protein